MHVIPYQAQAESWPESILAVPWPEIRLLTQVRWLQNQLNIEEKQGYIISSFIIVEANDPVDVVEQEIVSSLRRIETADGQPLDEHFIPIFEWILIHPTCYEAAFIHCDREYAVSLFIPRVSGMAPEFLEMGACCGQPVPSVEPINNIGAIMKEDTSYKFTPGQVVATRGALAAMQEHRISPDSLLRRHLSGDWGTVPVEDAQLNDLSLGVGVQAGNAIPTGRLLSSYDIAAGVRVWIITEWDRSSTTFLLPSEY